MKTGKGTLRLAPIMMWEDGSIVITELPGSKNTDSVYKILEKEFTSDKLDIRDESTSITRIVIEKVPYKQVDMEEVYSRLYNKLQVNEICNMAFFDQNHIYVPCSFDKVVKANLQYLINTHQNRIAHQLEDLRLKLEVLEVIEKIKSSGSVKELVDFDTTGAIEYISVNYNTTKDISSKKSAKLTFPVTFS